jgi:hypothetical protein
MLSHPDYLNRKPILQRYVFFLFFILCITSVNAQNTDQALVAFRSATQGASVVLKSGSTTLFNTLEQQAFPYGYVLPDAFCHRDDVTYVIDVTFTPDATLDPLKRYGLFSLGVNVSGHDSNAVSLTILNGNKLIARLTSIDDDQKVEKSTIQTFTPGQSYNVQVRFDSHTVELFFNGTSIGSQSMDKTFFWENGKPICVGGERDDTSVFNDGQITDFSIAIKSKQANENLAVYRLTPDGSTHVLTADQTTLSDTLQSQTDPHGYVLPDAYCERDDVTYVIDTSFTLSSAFDSQTRYGLFSLGLNVSGHEANVVSLTVLNGGMLMARLTSADADVKTEVKTTQSFVVGQTYSVQVRFDSNKVELFLDGISMGSNLMEESFVWESGKTIFVGGENATTSILNNGQIDDFAMTVLQKQPLATYRLAPDATLLTLKPDGITLSNTQQGLSLPHGFVLPDLYCNRIDVTYVIDTTFTIDSSFDSQTRYGLFSLGVNVSGHEANALSLTVLNGNMLMARLSSADNDEQANVSTIQTFVPGQSYNVQVRVDSHKIELFLDSMSIGIATVANTFSWDSGKAIMVGGERSNTSVLNNGQVTDFAMTVEANLSQGPLTVLRLIDQGDVMLMQSENIPIASPQSGTALPQELTLPDAFCERDDVTYVIEGVFTLDSSFDSSKRYGLFAQGVNVSGHDANAVSLTVLNGNTLMARISSLDADEQASVLATQTFVVGQPYKFEVRVDSNKMELLLDDVSMGIVTVANTFSWITDKPTCLGGERTTSSVLDNGDISVFSISVKQEHVDNSLLNDPDYQELIRNPHIKYILGTAQGILINGPEYYKDQIASQSNDWLYRDMANASAVLAYCYTLEHSGYYHSTAILDYLEESLTYLCDVSNLNDWVSTVGGDTNINRFTLVPLMEAIHMVGDDLSATTLSYLYDRLRIRLNNQYNGYGVNLQTAVDVYPNMDAFYMVAMLHGSQLLGDTLFTNEYQRVLNLLAATQYADGAWPYISTTNENVHYHEMVLASVARVYLLTQSTLALDMVEQSIPFYKLSVGPSMMPEYVTDVFWKHNWGGIMSRGPDIVAGLTGDAQNKWVANNASVNGNDILDIYAAMCWQDMSATPLTYNNVALDSNVNGPRGQFAKWNWVCSARYGSDTLVGCYNNANPNDPSPTTLQGLLAVRAEIGTTNNGVPDSGSSRFALGMPPSGYNQSVTQIIGDTAIFSADYKMGCFRSVWGAEPYPKDWNCYQQWTLDGDDVTGVIQITSNVNQDSPAPLVRFVFGRSGTLQKVSSNQYTFGPYLLTINYSDLTNDSISHVPVSTFSPETLDGYELKLTAPQSSGTFQKDDVFTLTVTLTKN